MKPGEQGGIHALSRLEVGWGLTGDGQSIVMIRPTAKSPDTQMLPFGLPPEDAEKLMRQLAHALSEIEKSRRPSQ